MQKYQLPRWTIPSGQLLFGQRSAAAVAATAVIVGVVVLIAAAALREQEHDNEDQNPSAGIATKQTVHIVYLLPQVSLHDMHWPIGRLQTYN